MAQGKRQVRGRREGRGRMAEALALTLLQPRRDLPPGPCTLSEYEAAPKLKILSFEEVNSLGPEARLKMKRAQSE